MPYLRVKNELPLIPGYASGNIVSFSDGYPGAPLNMLKASVIGSQSGTGDPSPDNVRPIIAYFQAVITQTDEEDTVIATRTASFGLDIYKGEEIDLLAGKGIVTHLKTTVGALNWGYTSGKFYSTNNLGILKTTGITMLSDTYKAIENIASSSIAMENKAICSISVSAGLDRIYITDSRYTDETQFKTAMADVEIVYPVATPIPIIFTPIENIPNLSGPNIIQADCGPIELKYIRRLDS